MDQDELSYLLAFHSIDGLGPLRLQLIHHHFGSFKAAWNIPINEFNILKIPHLVKQKIIATRKTLDREKYLKNILDQGIQIITVYDDLYPPLLKQIYDPPQLLFVKGDLPQMDVSIAIVGSRDITDYGKTVTEKISQELARFGVVIISGLARGVDTVAHQTAIKNQTKTVAVLGGGLNNIYPKENIFLAESIAQGYGAVISEYHPDTPSLPTNFPARNRIIAGLSLATVVTEAAERSGSLITAKLALDYGREVYGVPGPITSPLSLGPASLIKDGARLITYGEEILEDLNIDLS